MSGPDPLPHMLRCALHPPPVGTQPQGTSAFSPVCASPQALSAGPGSLPAAPQDSQDRRNCLRQQTPVTWPQLARRRHPPRAARPRRRGRAQRRPPCAPRPCWARAPGAQTGPQSCPCAPPPKLWGRRGRKSRAQTCGAPEGSLWSYNAHLRTRSVCTDAAQALSCLAEPPATPHLITDPSGPPNARNIRFRTQL
jgi:hypothetical protein